MIGIFYGGGYATGIVLTIILLLYRWYFGGAGFYSTAYEVLFFLPMFFFSISTFHPTGSSRSNETGLDDNIGDVLDLHPRGFSRDRFF
jgi:hypothetical protein